MSFIDNFITKHRLPNTFEHVVTQFYLPLIQQLVKVAETRRSAFFVGVNGCQGSGKSTLAEFITQYIPPHFDLSVVSMSLDDFYYSSAYRQQLAQQIHPLLRTRGVPGTHDTRALKEALEGLSRSSIDLTLPRFDKKTDNPMPQALWPHIDRRVDIVLMEGWCWGVAAQSDEQLQHPVNDLEENEDPQGIWRRYVNQQLAMYYEPLYPHMDYWLMLKAPSFSVVQKWRTEQESKLADSVKGQQYTGIMNAQQLARFTKHYQRLTEHALNTLPARCDCVLELDAQRNITTCHFSSNNLAHA